MKMDYEDKGMKYKGKSGGSLEEGVSDMSTITERKLRSEGQGQRPTSTKKSVSTDHGSFTISQ